MKSLYRSFAGGELTPEMMGRIDLAKFQTGLQTARNFTVLPHGPAARRPGLELLGWSTYCSDSEAWLVPFVASDDQAYMIVLHAAGKFSLVRNGAPVLGSPISVTSATAGPDVEYTLASSHGWAQNQMVYSGGQWYAAKITATDKIKLRHPVTGNVIAATPVTGTRTFQQIAEYTWAVVTADTLDKVRYAQNGESITLTIPGQKSWAIAINALGGVTSAEVSFANTQPAPTGVTATATTATATNLTAQKYVVTSLAADLVTESSASAVATVSNNLTIQGNFNTISWSSVPSAARYYVYKLRGGVYGYIGQSTSTSMVDDNILPDTLISPPEVPYPLNADATNAPTAVTYFERRRWFAGTATEPQAVWATRSATEGNLSASIPSRADDALKFGLATQRGSPIQHLVPLIDLIVLTSSGEFRVFADGGPAITPDTLAIKPQGFSGSHHVQPALTERSALYVQAQGSRIRELDYDPNGTGVYRSSDVTLLAPHLVVGRQINQLAYSRAPTSTLWALRDDGVLLGLTYVPDQQVYGWHQHNTVGGEIISIAVLPEGGEDALYMVVRRTITLQAAGVQQNADGSTTVLPAGAQVQRVFIERMKPRVFVNQADAFFVDCGLTYSGTPATTISGLTHLEGQTVQILADGAVAPSQVVTNGAITLQVAASKVHIGLGYVSDLVTLPLAYEGAPAAGQATRKNVNTVFLRVAQSSAAKAGPTFAELREYPARQVSDPWDSPPAFRSAELDIAVDPSWNAEGSVCVRQDLPLPLTVVSMALDTATGG